ncbi:hypothetical protein Q5P01_002882 [Channa striata]|uniref:Ig-like domain-containing protein n=1 Tax=Channa striata TaxID=64152 RepID=A0AA88NV37_CHASR|nr:hypothetical protein Q5P01_002882 [Channa striata]
MDPLCLRSPLRTISVLVVHLLTHFCGGKLNICQSRLIGSSQPIVAKVGDDVILPSHLEPAVGVATKTLEWTRPDLNSCFVHVWFGRQDYESIKHPSYKGRTRLFTDELKRGNISLKLSNVKPADGGRYRCYIPDRNEESVIELVVAAVSSLGIIFARLDESSSGVVLQCESKGWYPEPEVLWLTVRDKSSLLDLQRQSEVLMTSMLSAAESLWTRDTETDSPVESNRPTSTRPERRTYMFQMISIRRKTGPRQNRGMELMKEKRTAPKAVKVKLSLRLKKQKERELGSIVLFFLYFSQLVKQSDEKKQPEEKVKDLETKNTAGGATSSAGSSEAECGQSQIYRERDSTGQSSHRGCQGTQGSVSSPGITLAGLDESSSGVDLQCESKGWYPEPEVLWLDGEGHVLSAGPTETVRGPDDLYTVSSRVTVDMRHGNRFTCRVQQTIINQTRETHIHVSVQYFTFRSWSDYFGCLHPVYFLFAFILWKKKNRIKSKNSQCDENDEGQRMSDTNATKTEDQGVTEEGQESERDKHLGQRVNEENPHIYKYEAPFRTQTVFWVTVP